MDIIQLYPTADSAAKTMPIFRAERSTYLGVEYIRLLGTPWPDTHVSKRLMALMHAIYELAAFIKTMPSHLPERHVWNMILIEVMIEWNKFIKLIFLDYDK